MRLFVVLITAFSLGACALHPLPEDFSGVSTYHIVRQIRCETRQAVIDSLIGWLTHDPKVDAASRAIGYNVLENPGLVGTLDPKLFKGRDRSIIDLFWNTGVAYNYSLEMTETNNLGTEINLLKPFIRSKDTFGFKAGFDRQRQNTRTFTVTDTFSKLIRDVHADYCVNYIVRENYIYPITGRIGMEPVIQEFVRLTLFGNLTGDKNPVGPPTMVDALEFQTTFSGSANPKVTFTPVGTALSVTDASFTAAATRKDVHKVTVGLAVATAALPGVGVLRTALFGRLLTASGGGTERAAAEAVDQVLTQKLFSPTVIISP